MTPAEQFRSEVIASLASATGLPRKEINALLEKPPPEIPADLAFPCFSLAKKFKRSPSDIAADLSLKITEKGLIKGIEPSGPYVNFYADWASLGNLLLKEILSKKGSSKKRKEKILVEFAHPNTHKAFHIGHVRNIAFGEALSRILEYAGFQVVRANYQGDIGPHVAKCLWGILHLKQKEPTKDKGVWLGKVYAAANQKIAGNEKFEKEVREINKKIYAGDKKLLTLWKKTRQWSLDYFDSVYKDFGTTFDRLYFESEVEASGVKLAKSLLKKGIAKKSEQAIIMDLKKWNLGVFVLLTREETPLYSIKDFVLAELQEKEFSPSKIIHVVGTEQILYFRQLFKSLEITNPAIAKKELHLPYELVTLKSGKMSSREGAVITYDALKKKVLEHAVKETKKHSPHTNLQETAEMITLGGIKYDMLKQSREKTILFDWKQALSFEGNAAPYLQYTHARATSILEKGKIKKIGSFDAQFLKEEKELSLLKKLLEFPETVAAAARDFRPHYLATYLHTLATTFNEFYQAIPVLKSPSGERKARLALVKATQLVLGRALTLLGIGAPDKM